MKTSNKTVILILIISVITLLCICSCKKSQKQHNNNIHTNISNKDLELNNIVNIRSNIYRVILERSLKEFSGYTYSGESGQNLFIKFLNKQIDSTYFLNKIHQLNDQIKNNDSLKKTLFVQLNHQEKTLNLIEWKALGSYPKEIIAKIEKTINKGYSIDLELLDFALVNLIPIEKGQGKLLKNNEIGIISFSDIYFFDEKTAFVYVDFTCGMKCGQGAIMKLNIIDKNWKIVDLYSFWET